VDVDRSDLVSLIDQLVSVKGGDQVAEHADRPVLVVEGTGGSGRSTLLRAMWDKWAGRTPTAWVNPRLLGDPDAGDLRPVLLAAMLGLSAEVPDYAVKFPRVIAAYIAMRAQIGEVDPDRAAAKMRETLVSYEDRDNLVPLVGSLVGVVGQAVRAAHPQGGEVVAALTDEVAPRVVDRLRRSRVLTRLALGRAADWFGHQDRGLRWDPYTALVQLSRQAQIDTDAVRRDVDDLLVRALLADLRDSLSSVVNRPCSQVPEPKSGFG
jgi:hypothetical protein